MSDSHSSPRRPADPPGQDEGSPGTKTSGRDAAGEFPSPTGEGAIEGQRDGAEAGREADYGRGQTND